MATRRRLLKMLAAAVVPVVGGAAWLLPRRANAYYRGPVSDHFDGERFFNPGGKSPKGLDQVLRLYAMENWIAWPAAFRKAPTTRPSKMKSAPSSVRGIAKVCWKRTPGT